MGDLKGHKGKNSVVNEEFEKSHGSLKTPCGFLKIENIKLVKHGEKVKVYNFTVADFHTHFVSDLGIWVHNIDSCDYLQY